MKRHIWRLATIFLFIPLFTLSARTPIPAGASYDLGFSPGGSSLAVVLKAIHSAKTSLLVACYEFTDRDIAEAIESAAHKGVKVKIVADYKAAQAKYSQIRILKAAGISIRLDERYSIHHHKFIVIDFVSIETGSFNYTTAAVKHNAENTLVLWNVPKLARDYKTEFDKLWEESSGK
jgi:phosphatidylserine/phosphatidylglycerophosphate/cardiolipin synthase-like enzyme